MGSDPSSNFPAFRALGDLVPRAPTSLSVRSGLFSIPPRTRQLLFVSDEDPNLVHHGPGISLTLDFSGGGVLVTELPTTEASTIFTRLTVRRPAEPSSVPRPNYFPTYAGLTPEQRWVYLSWLSDV